LSADQSDGFVIYWIIIRATINKATVQTEAANG